MSLGKKKRSQGKKSRGGKTQTKSKGNVYWRDLERDAYIKRVGSIYYDKKGRTVFWHGQEAARAQDFLEDRDLRSRKPPKKAIEWKDVRYGSMQDPTGKGREKFYQWYSFGNSKGHWYEVFATKQGGVMPLMRTHSKKEALAYFKRNKNAIGIQRYKGQLTAGLVAVWPHKIKVKGKTYRRAYQGPHDEMFARKVAAQFKPEGVVRKVDRGFLIYYEE